MPPGNNGLLWCYVLLLSIVFFKNFLAYITLALALFVFDIMKIMYNSMYGPRATKSTTPWGVALYLSLLHLKSP